jgi:uncharacterized protein YdbL (DUF1318 family)
MGRTGHHIAISILLVFALLAVPAGVALADPLADAKRAGSVGERPDGYLGMVGNASAEVRALVQDINGKRRQKYGAIAKKNGTSVATVAALAGAKLVENAAPGEYVMTSAGNWVRKR